MIKTSNTTYAKFSHYLQHTDMKNFATDAALSSGFVEKSLEKNCLISSAQMFSCHL